MDDYILAFLVAVAVLYVPVLGWCWMQKRRDIHDPYKTPWGM